MTEPTTGLTLDHYERIRAAWKPKHIRFLLVGESAPDPGKGPVRFFYTEPLSRYDNLYRAVVMAFLNDTPGTAGAPKHAHLLALKKMGVFLIDAVTAPVNHQTARDRRKALKTAAPDCVRRIKKLNPDAVIVCHAPTFKALSAQLNAEHPGLLLHDHPFPFPLGNKRAEFVSGVKAAVAQATLTPPAT